MIARTADVRCAAPAPQSLRPGHLAPPGLVAGMLAFAGLPLYIHVPRYFALEIGFDLGVLGAVLLASRALDSVQDPFIGRLADRSPGRRESWALAAGCLLAGGFALLFAPPQWGQPMARLAAGLVAAFTGFSALQIALYDHGLAQAATAGGGHTRIALWREAGGLAGICLAALAPAALGPIVGASLGYTGYAAAFALFALVALAAMRGCWRASAKSPFTGRFGRAVRAPGVAPMLAFGFLNSLPVAVTSTLFLFFVADILLAEGHAGFMLVVFFAAAAAAAPAWARIAARTGRKPALTAGMSLSVAAFLWAYVLGAGDIAAFYAIAAVSGAGLGADMTLTPAMLAARIRGGGAQVFSLWTFLQKSALAVAAGAALTVLGMAGYEPGVADRDALRALAAGYALVPGALKLLAMAALWLFVTDRGDRR